MQGAYGAETAPVGRPVDDAVLVHGGGDAERVGAPTADSVPVPSPQAWGEPAGPSGLGIPFEPWEPTVFCVAATKDGGQCKARALTDGRFCVGHQRQVDAARRDGGASDS